MPCCRRCRRSWREPARWTRLGCAVILKPGTRIIGIDDSKKLNSSAREVLVEENKEKAATWCVAFVDVEEIDTINIYWAGLLAMRRAVEGLQSIPQHLLIDAKRLKQVKIPQQSIIKGDTKSASIAAASILAKVSRDAMMRTLEKIHPCYGFADHKGYPVRAHYAALSHPALARPTGARLARFARCSDCHRCPLGRRHRNGPSEPNRFVGRGVGVLSAPVKDARCGLRRSHRSPTTHHICGAPYLHLRVRLRVCPTREVTSSPPVEIVRLHSNRSKPSISSGGEEPCGLYAVGSTPAAML
jgi:ribonuclease HII